MNEIIINGWQEGFQKIPMTKLIRAYTGYGLDEGKHCVDDILEGDTVTLRGFSDEQAKSFVAEARALGAICKVKTPEPALSVLA